MRFLDRVERLGNRLPDPATLFLIGTLLIMALSAIAVAWDWSVHSTTLQRTLRARNLLDSDGVWWLLSHLIENFIRFPPLAIVLVGMLGIGLAERSGLLPALLRTLILRTPARLLTPAVVFLGIMSSLGLDAGYVILPPLAAGLYLAAGRSPLAGVAAAFAGVSAGFSANLVITAVDALLAGLTQAGASFIEPGYQVAVTANWWFMAGSTVVLTLAGWAVTAWYVEPRLSTASPSATAMVAEWSVQEQHALHLALWILAGGLILAVASVLLPGAPLHGTGAHFARWIEAIVPLLFLLLLVSGLVYGCVAGTIRSDRDAARMLGDTMARLGPYIVLAFFAAQFIESFKYSGLGEMLAVAGGEWLVRWALPAPLLMCCFILLAAIVNLVIGSASAKYAFLAPVFVPMFMQVGISPELTQAAYRVGDSVTNVITPFNPYLIIILAEVQRHTRGSGVGTVIALMLPYSMVFLIIWSLMLVAWMITGLPLGPGGGLYYKS
jgi:aminobenzoyl-glutamate transport protein